MKTRNSYALKFFILIQFGLGLSFLFPKYLSVGVYSGMIDFMPTILWAVLFIIFSALGFFSTKLWQFVFLVSIPLSLFSATITEAVVLHNNYMGISAIVTYGLIGFGSAVIAAKVYQK